MDEFQLCSHYFSFLFSSPPSLAILPTAGSFTTASLIPRTFFLFFPCFAHFWEGGRDWLDDRVLLVSFFVRRLRQFELIEQSTFYRVGFDCPCPRLAWRPLFSYFSVACPFLCFVCLIR